MDFCIVFELILYSGVQREGEGIEGEESKTHTLKITHIYFTIRKEFKGTKPKCRDGVDVHSQIN
jgi:hypothetical protein